MAKNAIQRKALQFLDELREEELQAWFQGVMRRRANYMDLVNDWQAGRLKVGEYKALGFYIPAGTKLLLPL